MNNGLLGYPKGTQLHPGMFGFPLGRLQQYGPEHEAVVDTASSGGVQVLVAAINTKGSWTQLTSSAPLSADGFYLRVNGNTGNGDFLLDIGIGAAGSEVALLENVLVSTGSSVAGADNEIYIPLPIRGGDRISARLQSTDNPGGLNISVHLVRGGLYTARKMCRATTYGADTSDSGGIAIDPGGAANTKGSWVQIVGQSERSIKTLIACFGSRNNGVIGTTYFTLVDIGVGPAGAEVVVLPNMRITAFSTSDVYERAWQEREVTIPAGSRIAARAQSLSTDATDRLFDIALIGFD